MHVLVLILLALASCSPSSLEDFHHEGEARCRKLVLELRKIEDYEQLVSAENVLKNHFEKLVDLMIEARKYQIYHPDDAPDLTATSSSLALKEELRRIYTIEGGREIIEKVQQEALVRLETVNSLLGKDSLK